METLYFALGVLTVLALVGVVGLLMVWKKAENALEKSHSTWDGIDSLSNDLGKEIDKLNRSIDDRIKDTYENINALEQNLNSELNEFQKNMDSRLDKFENRLTKIFEDGCKPVQEK
jgi:peptidoglycan hydrolase CwlO-like protein